MMENPLPHLATLGLEPGASREDVKKAYRDLSKVWHPDRFGENPRLQRKAEEQTKAINDAYRHLQSYDPSQVQSGRIVGGSIPSVKKSGGRILQPHLKFSPTEKLPLIIAIAAIILALLLVWTAL